MAVNPNEIKGLFNYYFFCRFVCPKTLFYGSQPFCDVTKGRLIPQPGIG